MSGPTAARGERRREVLWSQELEADPRALRSDPDPDALRESLAELDAVLATADESVHQRVRLFLIVFVATWDMLGDHVPAEPIATKVEVLPASVRLRVRAALEPHMWERLVRTPARELVSAWGRDRRRASGAWFEFGTGNGVPEAVSPTT